MISRSDLTGQRVYQCGRVKSLKVPSWLNGAKISSDLEEKTGSRGLQPINPCSDRNSFKTSRLPGST